LTAAFKIPSERLIIKVKTTFELILSIVKARVYLPIRLVCCHAFVAILILQIGSDIHALVNVAYFLQLRFIHCILQVIILVHTLTSFVPLIRRSKIVHLHRWLIFLLTSVWFYEYGVWLAAFPLFEYGFHLPLPVHVLRVLRLAHFG